MSVLLERLEKEGEVPLERYGHQVGGRQLFLKYRDCLCKPLIPRERFFYQTAPAAVRRYIPQYFGVVSVNYVKQPSGEIKVVASLKDPHQEPASTAQQFPKCTNGHSSGVSVTSTRIANTREYFTPWAQMCSDNMDKGLNQMDGDLQDFNKDYVILENLTSKFEAPSVLDLKVGTNWPRTPSPQTPPTSAKSSTCVRMAGMQKFDRLKNQYTFYDKYFGKEFSEAEFGQVLRSFLDNGTCFRSDLLPSILKMLKDLEASIRSHPSFRYFSSSLLLIYDGAEHPSSCRRQRNGRKGPRATGWLKKRKERQEERELLSSGRGSESSAESMVAFSEESSCSFGQSKQPRVTSPSDSPLRRLAEDASCKDSGDTTSLSSSMDASFLSRLIVDSNTGDAKVPSGTSPRLKKLHSSSNNGSDNPHQEAIAKETSTGTSSTGKPPPPHSLPKTTPNSVGATPLLISDSELAEHRCRVDLRMIDFARSTHADHFDQVCYEGLDEYYLTGLGSLIRTFQEMMDEFS